MTIDPNNEKHIIADEGKVFQRIVSKEIYGNEIYLGYSYYIDGVLQNPPHEDKIEDFEEIDEPAEEEIDEEIDNETENTEE